MSTGNLQNYTISRLLQDCYLCTSMGKLITKACWIILLLYLLFFNANAEVEQQSRAIIREKPTPCMQKRTIKKSSKPVLYYNNSSATHRLILFGDIETNRGPANCDNHQTKPKSDRLRSSYCDLCSKTVRINSKKLMCIHCKSLVHLQCSGLKAILIIKNSRKTHEWVCESCHFRELPFSGVREFHEITATSPTKINSVDYENIHISNFKSHRKHLNIGHLSTQSMVSSFDEFIVMLQEHPFDILTLSETWLKDDVNLLNYVQIPGYKFSYKNQN